MSATSLRTGAAAVFVLTLGASSPAWATATETGNQHSGFLLQIQAGLGFLSSRATESGVEAKMEGAAGLFNLTLGGSLSPTVGLGGSLWASSASSPTFSYGSASASPKDTTLSLAGFGPTVIFWLEDANVYFSITPSITRVSIKDPNETGETEFGLGVQAMVGKEWWVSDCWGIGIAGVLQLSSNKDKGSSPPTWTSGFIGVAASFTYN